ncbi:MAG: class II aldolase/adducin family protein [Bacteroidales bacterium]|nr:class II aldolase/adducin family protein [Bacteroidales bacterium]
MIFQSQRKEVAYFMRRLYEQNLTTCSGGNISFKVDEKIILITPSQLDKARLTPEQIGIVTVDGENLNPELKPSMETGMHLSIYKKRPDIKAVVHAHPPCATSFSATNKKVNCKLNGEARFVIGDPVYTKYALMGSEELAEIVSEATLNGNVVLMKNHGVLTVGKTLLEAFDRLEVFEASAKITLITELLGERKELSADELNAIDELIK